jgi:hypothetical protein
MRRSLFAAAIGLLSISAAPAQTFNWNLAGNGTWNDANSWSPNSAFPNSTTAEALFGNGITTTSTVSLTVPVTVNRLVFDGITGTRAYTIG